MRPPQKHICRTGPFKTRVTIRSVERVGSNLRARYKELYTSLSFSAEDEDAIRVGVAIR